MTRPLPLTLLAAFLAGCASVSPRPAATGASLALTHATVLDPATGARLVDHTVVVTGDRITAVGPSATTPAPPGATVVDATGRFVLPGFCDLHVHAYTAGDLMTYVANGVTTVRHMAGDTTILGLRQRVRAGRLVGPRIVTAGYPIENPPSWHDHRAITDPAAVRPELLRQRAMGFDFVKVYNRLSPAVYDSVAAVARDLGMPVAGHVPHEVGLDGALRAQASIEHLRGYVVALDPEAASLGLDASFRDRTLAWLRADTTRLAALAARTAAAGVWNVPTFSFTRHEMAPAADHARLLARPELRYLSLAGLPRDRTTGYLAGFSDADFAGAIVGLTVQGSLLRALDRAGAGLLVGTDSWLAGFAYADELEALVGAGLPPARVLRMATADAARFLGDDAGRVAPGLRADLVVLDRDPSADVGAARHVRAVVLRGRLLDRAALDALLAAAEADARLHR